MSTSYYRFKDPISSVRLEEGPGHDRLTIWENGANAGTLTLSLGTGRTIVKMLMEDVHDGACPMRTHWGGVDRGTVVTINPSGKELTDDIVLVSEYGEVLKVADVKARDGARRKDGMPTELFGFEKGGAS